MEAIILAGGFGTRLQGLVSDLPKSMAPVNGKPFLEYLLNYLSGQGILKVVLSVGYLNTAISSHFTERYKNIQLCYAVEEEPLGTGGGVMNAMKFIDGEKSFILNGDSMFRIDLNAMLAFHERTRSEITVALREIEDTSRYGSVTLSSENRITGFVEKKPDSGPGYINGGIYMINRSFFEKNSFPPKFSLEKDCFEKYFSSSAMSGYPSKGYFLDIGVPDDYMKAQDEFKRFED